jgi:hypothetical protein
MTVENFDQHNALQRATGSEELDALTQRELRAEQMEFYQRANQPPFEGFGGRVGFKEFLTGCAIILALGLFFKYVIGVG